MISSFIIQTVARLNVETVQFLFRLVILPQILPITLLILDLLLSL